MTEKSEKRNPSQRERIDDYAHKGIHSHARQIEAHLKHETMKNLMTAIHRNVAVRMPVRLKQQPKNDDIT